MFLAIILQIGPKFVTDFGQYHVCIVEFFIFNTFKLLLILLG